MEEQEKNNQPLLEDILSSKGKNLDNIDNEDNEDNEIQKNDEKMREAYENYSKLLNKMKKNVDTMGENKLMNYQNLFNEFDKDMINFNKEQKKLLELKDILNSEANLPEKIKNNVSKVNKDFENKNKIFEKLKIKVEQYKEKYTKEDNKIYDDMFNEKNNEKDNEDGHNKKLIVMNNEQIYEERKNIIEQAKKTSSQVVDTSKIIKNVVNQQGECLNDIENNISEAVDNFKKGGEELKKYKKKTEKQIDIKKLCIALGGLIALLLVIYFLMKTVF